MVNFKPPVWCHWMKSCKDMCSISSRETAQTESSTPLPPALKLNSSKIPRWCSLWRNALMLKTCMQIISSGCDIHQAGNEISLSTKRGETLQRDLSFPNKTKVRTANVRSLAWENTSTGEKRWSLGLLPLALPFPFEFLIWISTASPLLTSLVRCFPFNTVRSP